MRDWDPAGRGLRKAGEGDGDWVGEASEGVELEREEEGAAGTSWMEAASELVVDLGTTEEAKTDGKRKEGERKEPVTGTKIILRYVTSWRTLMAVEVRSKHKLTCH